MSRIAVRLQPRASKDEVLGFEAGVLKARVTAPPEDGKANAALLELLSGVLKVPKTSLSVVKGQSSRNKVVACGLESPEIERKIRNHAGT